jgi:hypothetical protein
VAPTALLLLGTIGIAFPGWLALDLMGVNAPWMFMGAIYGLARMDGLPDYWVWWVSPHMMPRWALTLLMLVSLLVLIGGFLWALTRVAPGRITRMKVWIACLVFGLTAFISPPSLSTDVQTYAARGAMILIGVNPYHFAPASLDIDARFEPLLRLDPWARSRMPYGFAWAWTTAAVSTLASGSFPAVLNPWGSTVATAKALGVDSIPLVVYLFKLLALTGLIITLVLISNAAGPDARGKVLVLALIGLNPSAVLETAAMGHCEGVMMALWVAGVLLAMRERCFVGGAMLGLAAGIKWVPLAVTPLLVIHLFRRERRWPRTGLFLLGLALALVIPALAFDPLSAATWRGLREQSRLFGGGSLLFIPGLAGRAVTGREEAILWAAVAVRTVAAGLILGVLVSRALRPRPGRLMPDIALIALIAAIGGASFFQPWYVLWALPFAVLGRREAPRLFAATLALSLAAPLSLIAPIWAGNYRAPVQFAMFLIWAVPTLAALCLPPRLSLFFESTSQPVNESTIPSISSAI